MRCPPDNCELGDSTRCLASWWKDSGLRRSLELDARSDVTSPEALFLFESEDPPIIEASSPRIAFASALNTIGGTGTSSSELSPIENFQSFMCGIWSVGSFVYNGGWRDRVGLGA